MHKCRYRSIVQIALLCCCFGVWALVLLHLSKEELAEEQRPLRAFAPRILLWWTSYNEKYFYHNCSCGFDVCTITNDRHCLGEAKVILFHDSAINVHDMPLPRHKFQLWALLQDHSPQVQPILFYEQFLCNFNYTSTFSRFSDFPLTLSRLPDVRAIIKSKYLVELHHRSLTPILFMETDCDTMSGRENFVRELMSYVPVHSCGKCLRNADTPSFQCENDLLRFMAQFKFILAFEDVICEDYISSKYWLSLIVGAIPIYFGSPTIKDWAPHNRAAIYISDYHSVEDLADHIYYLDSNETAFNEYLHHKYDTSAPITNQRLLNSLFRHGNVDNATKKFEQFEQEMCEEISRFDKPTLKVANQNHLNCPLPQPYPAALKNTTQHAKYWKRKFSISKCVVHLLDRLLWLNAPYTNVTFISKLQHLVGWGVC